MYDMLSMKRTGVNWVKQLPKYASISNNEGKEELLSLRTPSEVYFGRQNNRDQHPLLAGASNVRSESFNDSESCLSRPADYDNFEQKTL